MIIRLFVDAHVFDKGFEGTRTFIKGIYSEMLNYSDIQLFLAANDPEILKKEFPPAENIFFIKYRSRSNVVRLAYEIPSIVRKYKIDYAHFQYTAPWVHNCKFIVTTHDLLFKEYREDFPLLYRMRRNYLFKRSAINADILTTVSEYSRQSIQKQFKIDAKKVSVIRNGIAGNFFEKRNKEVSQQYIFQKYGVRNYLLYVSRIEPRKNHALILKAFAELELHKKGYQTVFIGRESLKTTKLNQLRSFLPADVKNNLLALDEIDEDDLVHFYRATVLFLYPSKAEGFGIPALEAAALRTPVLCSRSTAMSDFSFFKEQFDPWDYESFKLKLVKLLEQQQNEEELNQVSRAIKKRYCWKRSAQQLYELIKAKG